MAMLMPKLSASRPAWSMNGSRSRRVSHIASGPMTDPKGTISPAKVDRCAAAAVVRADSSTVAARAAWMAGSAARVARQLGQLLACSSSLAEQAGQLLDMYLLLGRRPFVGAPVGTASTIGGSAGPVVGPRVTLGPWPAGAAAPP